jgi:hypothetical protein
MTNDEADRFLTDLSREVSDRMSHLKVLGRSISLKV